MMFELLAQAPDLTTGVTGWGAFGLTGLILGWLAFHHLPSKDKQILDLVSDSNNRLEKRDKEHQHRETERDTYYRESFERKDRLFCDTIHNFQTSLEELRQLQLIESEKCQRNYDIVLGANAMLVDEVSTMNTIIRQTDKHCPKDRNYILIVEDDPVCAHRSKEAANKAIKDYPDLQFCEPKVVSTLQMAYSLRQQARVILLDLGLEPGITMGNIRAFIKACHHAAVIISSGREVNKAEVGNVYAIIPKNETMDTFVTAIRSAASLYPVES